MEDLSELSLADLEGNLDHVAHEMSAALKADDFASYLQWAAEWTPLFSEFITREMALRAESRH